MHASTALLVATTALVLALLGRTLGRPFFTAGAWLAVTAALAGLGALGHGALPWQLLPLTMLGGYVFASTRAGFRPILARVPRWQPVAIQTFRIGVELAFWRLHAEGLVPVQATFEGRNLDILAGLTAPLVALGIAAGRIGTRGSIAWNVAGISILLNTIATVAMSVPVSTITTWPVVWIPAFLAPTAIFLHVVSIRQAART